MQNQIFSIKINDIPAELEISNGTIKCISGDTVHFEVAKKDIRSFLHVTSNKISFNFMSKNKVILSSKHCLGIIKCLNNTIGN